MVMADQTSQQNSETFVAISDGCFVTTHQILYGLIVKKTSFREGKKQEARGRMAAGRKAQRSPQAQTALDGRGFQNS